MARSKDFGNIFRAIADVVGVERDESVRSIPIMFLFPTGFIRRQVCHRRRAHAAPAGYVFQRNYKKSHRERVEQAIQDADLGAYLMIAENAYDESGRHLPGKIAVYVNGDHAAGLFFQFYARAKTERRRLARTSFESPRVQSG